MAFQYSRKQVGEKILKEANEAFLEGARFAGIRGLYLGRLEGYNGAWFWLNCEMEPEKDKGFHPLVERMAHALIKMGEANLPDDPELRGDMTDLEFAFWFAEREEEKRLARRAQG